MLYLLSVISPNFRQGYKYEHILKTAGLPVDHFIPLCQDIRQHSYNILGVELGYMGNIV